MVHEVLVLVQTPDAHLSGCFEPEHLVDVLHHLEVGRKRLPRERGFVGGRECADEAKNQQEREERQFMTGPVVEAGGRTERGPEVEREFRDRDVLRGRQRFVVQLVGFL